jgi:hypothetical protein
MVVLKVVFISPDSIIVKWASSGSANAFTVSEGVVAEKLVS